ncbi:MAG TPA: potassium channel family protein [Nocardioides sp.]|nr:potassium channel family protein [Nocardioides sp.]
MPSWMRPVLSFAGLLIAYYAFPLRLDSVAAAAVSLALTALGLGLLGWVLVSELLHVRRGGPGRSLRTLIIALILLVMTFSLGFYLVNQVDPDQVAELNTRTDALYFTLSTMATVGYGDVHAEGQVARSLVCALIVFNIVVVTSLYREYTSRRGRDAP